MKSKDVLLLAGVAVAGYMLAPKEVKQNLQSAIPSIGIDLSGLIGSIGEGLSPTIPDIPDFEIPSENNIIDIIESAATKVFSELPTPVTPDPVNIVEVIKDTVTDALGGYKGGIIGPGQLQQMLDDLLAKANDAGETGGDIETKTPNPWELFTELHPITQNVIAGVTGLGGAYGVVKGIQAVAPAGKTVLQAIADSFKTGITKTKAATVIPKDILKAPRGMNPSLWAQWLKHTPLSKGILKGLGGAGGGLFGVGGLALGLQEFLFSSRPTIDIISDPRAIFTGSGQFVGFGSEYDYVSEHMGVLEAPVSPEGASMGPSLAPTVIAPKPYEQPKAKTKPSYHEPKDVTTGYITPSGGHLLGH